MASYMIANISNGKVRMNTTNEQRSKDYLENFNREKVLKYLVEHEKPVVFDIGANNGSSLTEFKSWWPDAVVHSFEPQQECWAKLDACANSYPAGSVFVNKVGAGATESNAQTFYTHDITTGQSGFNKINIKSRDSIRLKQLKDSRQILEEYEASVNREREVPIIRLDAYIKNNSVGRVNLLKVDTQGHEPEVLSGLGDCLSDIDVIITELMFYDFYERSLSFSDIEKYLLPAGFKLYDISHVSKNPMNGRTDWVDVIYVNNHKL